MISLIVVLIATAIVGCKSVPEKAQPQESYTPYAANSREAIAAADLNRDVVLTVEFKPGQDGLSKTAKNQIQRALADARKMGTIKNVEVAVWSDKEYPAIGKSLPKDQVKLAAKRAKNLQLLIDKTEPSSDVNTFNMAKQPNSFQRWVNSRDAEVKSKLVAAGVVPRPKDNQIFDRTSTAIVFIEVR